MILGCFRKIFSGVLVVSLLCSLLGCWDRRELNELAIISAIGIDLLPDNQIELIIQQIVPQSPEDVGGGQKSNKTLVQSGKGKTVADAKADLQAKLGREVFWGHTEVILIGEKLARKGIEEYIDFLIRHPEIRLRANVFVSKKPREILLANPKAERFSVDPLHFLSKRGAQLSIDVNQLVTTLTGEGKATVLPWVEVSKPNEVPYIHGTAIFKQDKMTQRIDDKQTRALLWLRNEMKTMIITVSLKKMKGDVALKVFASRTRRIPRIEQGKWQMIVEITAKNDIVFNGTNESGRNTKFIKMVEKEAEEEIRLLISDLLKEIQKGKKTDIFGFGEVFHQSYPDEWIKVKDQWDEVLPNVEVKVLPKVRIKSTGMTSYPMKVPGIKEEGKTK